jgi:hypothetical protein
MERHCVQNRGRTISCTTDSGVMSNVLTTHEACGSVLAYLIVLAQLELLAARRASTYDDFFAGLLRSLKVSRCVSRAVALAAAAAGHQNAMKINTGIHPVDPPASRLWLSAGVKPTSGATILVAVEAGFDAVDAAMDTMRGTTSQPTAGSIVEALARTGRETCLNQDVTRKISFYWEKFRTQYVAFESYLRASASEV